MSRMTDYSYSCPKQEGEKKKSKNQNTIHHQKWEVTEIIEIITVLLSAIILGSLKPKLKNCRPF